MFIIHKKTDFVVSYAAGEIERIIRGKFGRNRAKAAAKAKKDRRQISLFNYLCIQMQRSFRGYYSRKYKHSQLRRKRYAQSVMENGEIARMEMEKYNQLQIEVSNVIDFVSIALIFRVERSY